jgi:hypothetical protein
MFPFCKSPAIALVNRSILAAPIAPPNSLHAQKGGAKLLVDMTKSGIYFPYSTIASTRGFLKQSRPVALVFMKAYSDGVKRMNSDKAFSIGVIKKYMRETDPEILDTVYQYGVDYIAKIPEPNKEGIVQVLRQSPDPKAKTAQPGGLPRRRVGPRAGAEGAISLSIVGRLNDVQGSRFKFSDLSI